MLPLALALLAFSAASKAADTCTVERDGVRYDLTPLQAKKDYEFYSPYSSASDKDRRKYYINVCQNVKSELWNVKLPATEASVGGRYRAVTGDFAIGGVNATLDYLGGSPTMLMTGGSACKDGGRAATAVRFVCDGGAGIGSPRLVAQLPVEDDAACFFSVEWRTSYACGSSSSGFFGVLLMLITVLFIAFIAYIGFFFVYNRFVLGLRGADQLPNIPISELITNISDFFAQRRRSTPRYGTATPGGGGGGGGGFRRGIPRAWQSGGSRSRSGYIGLPTDDEEANRPLNGGAGGPHSPFALDDDEIDERDLQGAEERAVPPPPAKSPVPAPPTKTSPTPPMPPVSGAPAAGTTVGSGPPLPPASGNGNGSAAGGGAIRL